MRAAAAVDLATVPASQVPFLPEAERQKYAESIGFTKVGAHLPDHVTLTDVIKSMPAEVRAARRLCCGAAALQRRPGAPLSGHATLRQPAGCSRPGGAARPPGPCFPRSLQWGAPPRPAQRRSPAQPNRLSRHPAPAPARRCLS